MRASFLGVEHSNALRVNAWRFPQWTVVLRVVVSETTSVRTEKTVNCLRRANSGKFMAETDPWRYQRAYHSLDFCSSVSVCVCFWVPGPTFFELLSFKFVFLYFCFSLVFTFQCIF